MMRTIIAACFSMAVGIATTLQAQNFEWARSFGGSAWDEGNSITVDASGNVYTTGYFRGTVDFDPGPGTANLTSSGITGFFVDIFIQKLDPSGNFLWAIPIGAGLEEKGNSITVDASGNVYTTGCFGGTVDFDPGPDPAILTSTGSYDVFVQKLDPSGNFLWAKSFGGVSFDEGRSITVDVLGNVYITGVFEGTVDFDPGAGTVNLTSAGNWDVFVQKLDPSGNFLWAKSFGGGSDDQGTSISADASGNVYTTGFFEGTVDFDPGAGTANLTSIGAVDVFVQKLNPFGNFLWAKSFGGGSWDFGKSVTVDASGNVYTAGGFEGTVDFDPGAGTVNLTSAGSGDVFIQKLNPSGSFLWAKSFGGTSWDEANSICTDASGNVYTTGYFQGIVDFNPGAGTANLTSAGSGDVFIQKLNPSGSFLWAKSFGGGSWDFGNSITVDASGNVYTTGCFQGTADFDPGAGTANLTSIGNFDVFVQKLSCTPNSGIDIQTACDSFTWIDGNIYTASNNSATFTLPNVAGCDSVVTLDLTILNSTAATDVQTACDSYTWIDGNTYIASNNTATHTLTNAAGCDSIVTLNLVINSSFSQTDVITACDSYLWHGQTYTVSGTYFDSLTSSAGCDSVYVLDLTVNYTSTSTLTETACDQYLSPSGKVFTASGTYLDTIPNSTGCDSLMTINLTILNSSSASFNASACDAYSWLGNSLAASGTYVDTLVNASGCDSIVTLNLVINSSFSQTDVITACDSYLWHGQTYTVSGTYFDSLTSSAGCDSVYVLDLTVNYTSTSTLTETACDQYLSPSGKVFTASGTYLDTIPNSAGCDSLMTINLTILNSSSASFNASACDAYSWLGNSLTASGTYVDTLVNASGCDSIVTLNLVINSSFSQTDVITACDSYLWHGQTYTVSGTYFDSLTSSAGCDSVYVLDLTVNYTSTSTLTETACDQYLSPSGKVFTASGTYLDTIPNSTGCDSLMTINLTILNSSSASFNASACDAYSWLGNSLAASGTYVDTLVNAAGCDSIITLNLVINSSFSQTDVITACDSYFWHGQTYTVSGTYFDSLISSAGCDSVYVLDLTINQTSTSTLNETACDQYLSPSGKVFTASGTYLDTIPNSTGCDSLMTINLTILNSSSASFNASACDAYSWLGNSLTASGTYVDTLVNASGCDSIVTLNLVINSSFSQTDVITACDSYFWHGQTYTVSGTYFDSLISSAGCDSVYVLDLTINQTSTSTLNETACDQYLSPSGKVFAASGTYLDTIPNSAGCDSLMTINLTVHQSDSSFVNAGSCGPYTWLGTTYSQSGAYTEVLTNSNGCDSIVTLNLTVVTVDTTVAQNDSLLTAVANASFYQWYNCDNQQIVPGANSASFTPTQTGHYAVILTQNGCIDTSGCHLVVISGTEQLSLASGIQVYPNPADDFITVELPDVGYTYRVDVLNMDGKLLMTKSFPKNGRHDIHWNVAPGVYLIRILCSDGIIEQKRVVKR